MKYRRQKAEYALNKKNEQQQQFMHIKLKTLWFVAICKHFFRWLTDVELYCVVASAFIATPLHACLSHARCLTSTRPNQKFKSSKSFIYEWLPSTLSLSLSLLSIYDNAQRWGCWKLCMTLNFFLLCVSLCFYLSTFFRSICPFVYVLNATSDCRHFWFIELWGVFKNI